MYDHLLAARCPNKLGLHCALSFVNPAVGTWLIVLIIIAAVLALGKKILFG